MNVIIKNVQITDPRSPHNSKRLDVHLKEGIIHKIGKGLKPRAAQKINGDSACLSPGWMDIGVYSGAPGHEHREDYHTLSKAAACGGYTDIALWPDTAPVTDTAALVRSISAQSSATLPVRLHSIASPVSHSESHQLSELHDLAAAGAVAFGTGLTSIDDMDVMVRILQYLRPTGKALIHLVSQPRLVPSAQVHESPATVGMGLPAMPSIEESLRVDRDISLSSHHDSSILLHGISAADSIKHLRAIKKAHRDSIHSSVAVMNLLYCDDHLSDWNSSLKVIPPLRAEQDMLALQKALISGDIDMVMSHHRPLEAELKDVPFGDAEFGAATIDLCYPLLETALGKSISSDRLVEVLSINPRKVTGCPSDIIAEGAQINLTLYSRSQKRPWKGGTSRSSNYPPVKAAALKGAVVGTFHGERIHLSEDRL